MLEALYLDETGDTPKVVFDPANNKFALTGRSLPENAAEFYQPLLDWLSKYSENPNPKTKLEINMFYFNTSSSKMVLDILFKMEDLLNSGSHAEIVWYCDEDDEDMVEMGEEFAEMVEVPVRIEFNEEPQ